MSSSFARLIWLAGIPSPCYLTSVFVRIVPNGLAVAPRGGTAVLVHRRISHRQMCIRDRNNGVVLLILPQIVDSFVKV